MAEFDDFVWTPDADLARLASGRVPWEHYLNTAVEFDGRGTVYPADADDETADSGPPPLGALHVVTAIQPDADPAGPDSLARLALLDRHLAAKRIRSMRALGRSLDGVHGEESRAVFGLDDRRARQLGRRFGQVAVFAWRGPRWSLLACVGGRQDHRGWRWEGC